MPDFSYSLPRINELDRLNPSTRMKLCVTNLPKNATPPRIFLQRLKRIWIKITMDGTTSNTGDSRT